MTKVTHPPPKPLTGALPIASGAPEEECRGCFIIGLGIAALSGAAVGFVWGVFVGIAAR